MDIHETTGFNPLGGHECIDAMCGSLRLAVSKNSDFDAHLAWPVFRWKIRAEIEYAPNLWADIRTHSVEVQGSYVTTDKQGIPTEVGPSSKLNIEVVGDAEIPDLIRKELIERAERIDTSPPFLPKPEEPSVPLGVETKGEFLAPPRPRGRPKKDF